MSPKDTCTELQDNMNDLSSCKRSNIRIVNVPTRTNEDCYRISQEILGQANKQS